MQPSSKNTAPENSKSGGVFVSTLAAMNDGQVIRDLDDALRDATRAALDAASKSKITLELTITPSGIGTGDTPLIKITDKIKKQIPNPARDKEPVFFADEDFNPTRRNPNQEEMKLEVVQGNQPAPAIKVNVASNE